MQTHGWSRFWGAAGAPAVFEAVGYDPERYTGFAFGMGIERVALLRGRRRHPLFYENDLRPGAVLCELVYDWLRESWPYRAIPTASRGD